MQVPETTCSMSKYGGTTAVALIALLNAGCIGGTNDYHATRADSQLASRVQNALQRDPEMRASGINIDIYRGQVQLAGFVHSLEQKVKAERIARTTPGVRAVTNAIVIKAR